MKVTELEILSNYAEAAFLLIAALLLAAMIFILYSILTDLAKSHHKRKFVEALKAVIEISTVSDDQAWAIEQLAERWNQSAPMVINSLQDILDEKARSHISNYEIKRLKDIMSRYESASTLSAIPFLLRPYVAELLQDSRYSKQKADQLAKHIRDIEVEYANKYNKQNLKNNFSLGFGAFGVVIAVWQLFFQ